MEFDLRTTPFLVNKQHGIFATRAPKRPNSIGISVVRLLSVDKNIFHFENVDMLNETPLLDIKPYIVDFDVHETQKSGWSTNKTNRLDEIKSDNRYK